MENNTYEQVSLNMEMPDPQADSEHRKAMHEIEEIVEIYGMDSLTYLAIEGEKQYYVSNVIHGFIAYVVVNKIAVCIGNPVCPRGKSQDLLSEFRNYCRKERMKICFSSVSEEFASMAAQYGFVRALYGQEAVLGLETYDIMSSKTAKLRQKFRRAERAGISVIEYIPEIYRNADLENKIHDLSREWFAQKEEMMTFAFGDLNFDRPLGRRYFVACDAEENVSAVLMFSPYADQKGYFLDVMRRKQDSVPGVMEYAIVSAAMKMKEEGCLWVSLGLAPLSGLEELGTHRNSLERLFYSVYQHGNITYDFQSLYLYKLKFNPTFWANRYVIYEEGMNPLKVAHVLAKVRNVEKLYYKAISFVFRLISQLKEKLLDRNRK